MFQLNEPSNSEEAKKMAEDIHACDYLTLVKNKLTRPQMAVFVFMVFIFASHMSTDMEEAAIEEALLLNAGFKEDSFGGIIPAQLLLVSLRYRRFILPWAIGAAVIAINLTDDLSIKNILLNVLALEFLLNADSLLVVFLCKSRTTHRSQFVQEMIGKAAKQNVFVSWWRPRVEACVVAFVMIVIVINPSVVDVLSRTYSYYNKETSCERLGAFLGHMNQIYLPLFFFIANTVSILYVYFISSRKSYSTVVREEKNFEVGTPIVPTDPLFGGRAITSDEDKSDVNDGDRKICKIELIVEVFIPIIASFCTWSMNLFFLEVIVLLAYQESDFFWQGFSKIFQSYGVLMLVFWIIYIIIGYLLVKLRSRDLERKGNEPTHENNNHLTN